MLTLVRTHPRAIRILLQLIATVLNMILVRLGYSELIVIPWALALVVDLFLASSETNTLSTDSFLIGLVLYGICLLGAGIVMAMKGENELIVLAFFMIAATMDSLSDETVQTNLEHFLT